MYGVSTKIVRTVSKLSELLWDELLLKSDLRWLSVVSGGFETSDAKRSFLSFLVSSVALQKEGETEILVGSCIQMRRQLLDRRRAET